MSGEVWQLVYDRLAALVNEHRTTLIFVNTRRLAERAARYLSERLGAENVAAHHGSLAREHRLDSEQRLKRGELRALVATASLELGIDIGDVDLVCQIGSTKSIAAFLQRVGRSGHAVGGTPKGRLFPLTRDELCECAALLDAVARGELDRITLPDKPLDVLAQQIVAEVGMQEWREDELLALYRRASPFAKLTRDEYLEVVRMLSDGFDTRRGRRAAYLHRDAVNGVLRGQRGAALTAVTSGGTIPDNADYTVLLEPQAQVVGTLNEDFAIESLAGDVFQLGNTSYRILRVERGTVRVEDAKGQPPTMPFWLGEAPGRTMELSASVSRLREDISARLDAGGRDAALNWLMAPGGTLALPRPAAEQIADYLAAAKAALGTLPTLKTNRVRALLRRIGRHAVRDPRAARQPHQPRLGPGAAQALLPQVRLRVAGRGDGRRDHPVALGVAQFSARRSGALSVCGDGAAAARASPARRADVRRALALERHGGPGAAANARRQEDRAAVAAHGGGRPARRDLSGPTRLRRKHRRRPRNPGPPARAPDDRRLPARRDGHRRARNLADRSGERRGSGDRARHDRALAAFAGNPERAALRVSRRRAARRTPHPGGVGAALDGPGDGIGPRQVGCRRDPEGARRSLARGAQRRRVARRPARLRIPERIRN